jgi:HK97 family phage major capsid protein
MTTDGAAAPLVPTQHLADRFIDRLRPSILLPQLGATVVDGLIGDADIPRQTNSAIAQWVGEDEELDASDLGFDDLQLRPKTVGALTSYSRRTIINAVPSIEQIVRNDLARVLAEAIDTAALLGDGSGNSPTGIANLSDVIRIDLSGGPTWAQILDLIAHVEAANADGPGLAWCLSAFAAKTLRATTKVAGDGSAGFIMDLPNLLAGYRAVVSSIAGGDPDSSPPDTASNLFFGNWSDLVLASWSGVDVLVNPYADSAFARGRVLVRAMRDVDVGVRHVESFSYAMDLTVTGD